MVYFVRTLVKSEQKNNFLIYQPKHMLKVMDKKILTILRNFFIYLSILCFVCVVLSVVERNRVFLHIDPEIN